jgi:hypothetical protein
MSKWGTLAKPAVAPHGAICSYPLGLEVGAPTGRYCQKPALWMVQSWCYCDEHVGLAIYDASLEDSIE